MENLIPEPKKASTDLDELISQILTQFKVEQIYLNVAHPKEETFQELLILISYKYSRVLNELLPMFEWIFKQYPQFHFRLFHGHQVKEALKKGNLFFDQACCAEHLVYQRAGSMLDLFSGRASGADLLERVKSNFEQEQTKIKAFREGADFYFWKQNFTQAIFMLHQVIELSYRTAELLVMGKDKKSHHIKGHMRYVAHYLPTLGQLFREDQEEETDLLNTLDEAYLAVRYENTYLIAEQVMEQIIKKANLVQLQVQKIYDRILFDFKFKYTAAVSYQMPVENATCKVQPELANCDKPHIPQELIEEIKKNFPVQRIYCFGWSAQSNRYRSCFLHSTSRSDANYAHFNLLIVAEGKYETVSNLQGKLNCDQERKYSVTLLLHSINEILDDFNPNHKFFSFIIQHANIIYGAADLPEAIGTANNAGFEYSDLQKKYFNRIKNAEAFQAAAHVVAPNYLNQAAVSLMHQSIEQLLLGSIFLLMHYTPKQYSLSYLVGICKALFPEPEKLLLVTGREQKWYHTLIRSVAATKYKTGLLISNEEAGLISEYCIFLLDTLKELCNQKLNEFDPVEPMQLPISLKLELDYNLEVFQN